MIDSLFGPMISSYNRAQAIEDGILIDVSETAKEAGFKFPVAVSRSVWDRYITPDPRSVGCGQSVKGRLWDVLSMLKLYAQMTPGDRVDFPVTFIMKIRQRRTIRLYSLIGPGDTADPVITIMIPGED